MISKLMDAMFGCRHARYSFPITVRAVARQLHARALMSRASTVGGNSVMTGRK